ncbi:MAG TPA: response regulator transcription factor, partial [Acidimicrobiales bacterium]|nr:response regulator transcription factor [Acidimicrobiales bacterium]
VEDDEAIGRSLVQALTGQGAAVTWARTANEALRLAGLTTELVLLDLGLPDVDGLDVCRLLRERYPRLDIIVVTARAEEIDVVVGLDAGADDYITKPFRLAELSARIRARLRRQRDATLDSIDVGDLHVDVAARRCSWRGEDIVLRAREFDLLAALALDAGHVVTRRRLLAELWDQHFESTSKTLDVHISAVRRKLDEAGAPEVITTIRTVGYRLEAP